MLVGRRLAIGALGCVALTRRLFRGDPLEPYAAAVMIAVFACNPFLLNHPAMGRTEYLPAALFPLKSELEILSVPLSLKIAPPSVEAGEVAWLPEKVLPEIVVEVPTSRYRAPPMPAPAKPSPILAPMA